MHNVEVSGIAGFGKEPAVPGPVYRVPGGSCIVLYQLSANVNGITHFGSRLLHRINEHFNMLTIQLTRNDLRLTILILLHINFIASLPGTGIFVAYFPEFGTALVI